MMLAQPTARELHVVMYPFIPEYKSVELDVKQQFEAAHPDVRIIFVDLTSNYYSPSSPNYIGNTKADVYELDSVFLEDFVKAGKLQPMPAGALLPAVKTLSEVEAAIGVSHAAHKGLLTDLKGKSTLGEFYLETAVDHFGSSQAALPHLSSVEPLLKNDLARLAALCDRGFCRNQDFHDKKPQIYTRQFARGGGRALIGYSESLHSTLEESNDACTPSEQCLSDSDIDVVQFPSDDAGRHQISWVDSFVLDSNCKGQCITDAVAFVSFMNSTSTYKQILLNEGSAPAYLLPAKASLYSDPEVTKVAHLYPKLKA